MPGGALFVCVGDPENGLLAERFSQQLQADGEFGSSGEAAGDAHAADAGQVGGDCEDVDQVHLQRVIHLFADFEGGRGGGWANDRVHFFEGAQEILTDQRADFLGAQIKCIVIPAAQHVGAEDDAAFDFRAES